MTIGNGQAGNAQVEVLGVEKSFAGPPPVHALRGVDLSVEAGSLTAVLGPSGCGKTTLLRIVAGFDRPDRGAVAIGGVTIAGPGAMVPPERRRIGIVPQEGALFPHLDVAGNIGFGLTGRARATRAKRVAELLELVGLAGYEKRRPHELSGGQQQRVAVARALAPRPEVVLLDEPFVALDTGLRASLGDDVAAALAVSGTTAVLVTHDQTEALTLASAVAVMRAGRIVQCAAPDVLYHRPDDLETAHFLGDMTVVPGRFDGVAASCLLGRLPAAAARPLAGGDVDVQVALRPEQLVVDEDGAVTATVRAIRYEGHDALVQLEVGNVLLLARWSTVDLPAQSATVGIAVRGDAVVFAGRG